jgi:hypothetical protein
VSWKGGVVCLVDWTVGWVVDGGLLGGGWAKEKKKKQ